LIFVIIASGSATGQTLGACRTVGAMSPDNKPSNSTET